MVSCLEVFMVLAGPPQLHGAGVRFAPNDRVYAGALEVCHRAAALQQALQDLSTVEASNW